MDRGMDVRGNVRVFVGGRGDVRMVSIKFDMPSSTEAAAHRLAAATKLDGYSTATVDIANGRVTNIELFGSDGKHHFVSLIGSDWFELFDIPGGEDNGC